jgi:serine/threonine-protein kinase
MMAALLTQTPVPPSIFAAMPPGIDRIVMRCLQREAGDRYASVGQLVAALDAVVAACSSRDEVTVEQPTFVEPPAPIAPPRFPTLPGLGALGRPPRRPAHGTPAPALQPWPAPPPPSLAPPPAWLPPSASLTAAPIAPAPSPGLAWIALVVGALAFVVLVAAIVTVATV